MVSQGRKGIKRPRSGSEMVSQGRKGIKRPRSGSEKVSQGKNEHNIPHNTSGASRTNVWEAPSYERKRSG